ncbi:MAG TPA: nucleotide exchange factor GrpE [Anaerolineales bacterium]
MADNDNAKSDAEAGPAPADVAADPAGDPPGDQPQPSPEVLADAAQDPAAEVARLELQVAEINDKLLRALAEAENVRRRAEREKEDAFKYAVSNFARDMLSVADNLRRAMASVEPALRKSDEALDKLIVGLELTERQMLATFERYGIRPIRAEGEKFDHNLHEALFEMEDPSRPAGTVAQVLETGYVLNDRLLRPAKVAVAKGGAKVERKDDSAPAAAEAAKKDGRGAPGAYESKGRGAGGKLDEKL